MISFLYIYTAYKKCKCLVLKQENPKYNQPYQQKKKKKRAGVFFSSEIARENRFVKSNVGKQSKLYKITLKGEI